VTGPCEVADDLMKFNGSIDIGPGGSMELRRSILKMDGASDGETGIQVRAGGKLTIAEGSTLMATNANWSYSLACRPGSSLVLDSSHLRDCGWDADVPEISGPYIETPDAVIRNSVVEGCPTALVMSGAGKGLVDGSRLSGTWLAIRLDNSSLELVNSTADSTGSSNVALVNGSRLICVNSSLDRERADFQDGASRLEVGWYLDVLVLWSDGRPAVGAGMTIQDALGTEVLNVSADAEGRARGMVLWETFITSGNRTVFTPHQLRCQVGPITNTTALTADRSRSLTVILPDYEPPSVSIIAPAPGSIFNSSTVEVTGTAQDNLALKSVELTVDGFERHMLYQNPGGELRRLDWNLTLVLPEGSHTVEVVAADTSGNTDFASIYFSIDFTLPRIVILVPREGFLTSLPEIAVSGIVEPGSEVFVNGVEARTLGSTFNAIARLAEGDNVITALAVDAAGNVNTTSTHVRLDTTPPRIEVSFDPDAPFVNQPQVNLSGTMEFGSSITVNGRLVVLPGLADNFTTLFFLARGNNTISIRATDAAGNANVTERRFVLDTVPPSFRVLYPPEGFQTREPLLTASLVAEAGTDLTAGAVTERVPGPPGDPVSFTLNYTLAEGANTIVLRARDAAGNTFTVVRDVILDTRAPSLAVQSPPDEFRTSNNSVYIIGITDPDAAVSVNGQPVAVGYTGAFSIELKLMLGSNRIVVAATDALGNANMLTINVTRAAAHAAEELNTGSGPDWPFIAFVLVAAAAAVAEGYGASRLLRRTAPRPGPAKGGG
jgi:hypothetical protein